MERSMKKMAWFWACSMKLIITKPYCRQNPKAHTRIGKSQSSRICDGARVEWLWNWTEGIGGSITYVCRCILELIFDKKEENGGIKKACCKVAWEVGSGEWNLDGCNIGSRTSIS